MHSCYINYYFIPVIGNTVEYVGVRVVHTLIFASLVVWTDDFVNVCLCTCVTFVRIIDPLIPVNQNDSLFNIIMTMQSATITTIVVSSNPAQASCNRYNIIG